MTAYQERSLARRFAEMTDPHDHAQPLGLLDIGAIAVGAGITRTGKMLSVILGAAIP